MSGEWHFGRAWSGSDVEDSCPCPKAACGLVIWGQQDPACDQHQVHRTVRQSHGAEDCPAALDGEQP